MENNNQEELIELNTSKRDTWVEAINDFYTYSLKLEKLLDEAKNLLLGNTRSENIECFIERVDDTIRR